MKALAIIYFFWIMWALGYSLVRIFKLDWKCYKPEKLVMTFGIGLASFSFLILIINTLGFVLHWLLLLILCSLIPLYGLYRHIKNKKGSNQEGSNRFFSFKLTKTNIYFALALLLFLAHLFVFVKGAFIYPYFEDGDPWWHGVSIKYIAEFNTYSMPIELIEAYEGVEGKLFKYGEPYPPFYDVIMAVEYQLESSMNWVLKFFNSLLISLSVLFIFFFVKQITDSSAKGFFAALFLAVIPSYLSHFIFSTSMAIPLFFVGFYTLAKIKDDSRWWYLAAIVAAGIFIIQPIASFWFLVFSGVFWLVNVVIERKFHKHLFLAIIFGLILAQLFWIPAFAKTGLESAGLKYDMHMLTQQDTADSSGGKVYSIKDYAVTHTSNMIDQPIGFGLVIFLLLILSILIYLFNFKHLFKLSNRWLLTFLITGFLAFMATESNALPFRFTPHRQWVFLSIAVVIICAFGLGVIIDSLKSKKLALAVLILVVILGVFFTSGYQKYKVNTSIWPMTEFTSFEEARDFSWLQDNLPRNTPVFQYCSNSAAHGSQVIAYDMMAYPWDLELVYFRLGIFDESLDSVYDMVKRKNFEYLVFGSTCILHADIDELNNVIGGLFLHRGFQAVHNTQNMWLFKVV